MADKTGIQWTDATWNPVTGCTKTSPGCHYCYIERTPPMRMAGRRFEIPPAQGPRWIPVQLHPERLDKPLHWRKPRKVFVVSMGDLFHRDVSDEFIDRVFATMAICGATRMTCKWAQCDHGEDAELERSGCWMQGEGRENPIHTFQVLTKRPERMKAYLSDPDRQAKIEAVGNDPEWSIQWGEPADMIEGVGWPLPNVWLGVSVEKQRMADRRIPILLDTPAARRFVSCEPLLGPLDLTGWLSPDCTVHGNIGLPGTKEALLEVAKAAGRRIGWQGLDWVIVGGESGGSRERALVEKCWHDDGEGTFYGSEHHGLQNPGTTAGSYHWCPKPEALEWVRSIRDQCEAAGVPFFLKQWGGPTPKASGRTLDGRTWDEFPQREAVPA